MSSPEILAPAGSMETLCAALRSGADAVYLGGKRFSARSSAANFTDEEIKTAADICHKYGAKLDLAVNTIITDEESEEFCRYIKNASKSGVDAFIVQDWGCAELIRRCVPDAVLHASTQMSVHTAAGAALLSSLGYERVVPARELDCNTIKKICSENIEVEIFTHGALCMSVSGQCYMSAMIGSRSANRGCCGQACRLPFSAVGKKDHAALSLKDLSLLPYADELKSLGIDSLKIEGRMKRPEYVASAVHELRNALDGIEPDMQLLRGIFSRSGFTDGYYSGKRKDMFGVREKEDVTAAQSLIPKIHELYRFERKVHDLNYIAAIKADQPVTLTSTACGVTVSVTGDVPEKALNRPTDAAALEKQLSRLGDTVFRFGGLESDIDSGLIVPAGKLNDLRRRLTDKLTEEVIKKNTPSHAVTDYKPSVPDIPAKKAPEVLPLRTYCRTVEQAEAAVELSEFIILDHKLCISGDIFEKSDKIIQNIERVIISPPRFIVNEEKLTEKLSELKDKYGCSKLYCHTPDHIAIGKKLGYKLHGSFTLNVYNSYSAEHLHSIGIEDCIFSIEATLEQLSRIRTEMPLGAVVYGRLPLMLTRNCPIQNEVGCKNCTGSLTDRTGRKLPVMCCKDYTEILNPDVLFMLDRKNEINNICCGLVMLSDESAEQTKLALKGIKPEGNITRGLYYRGI